MFRSRSSEDYLSAQLNNSLQFFGRGKGWQEDSSCCRASQPTHTSPHTHTKHTHMQPWQRRRSQTSVSGEVPAMHFPRLHFHIIKGAGRQHSDDVTPREGLPQPGREEVGGGGGTAEPDDHPSTSLTLRVHHPSLAFQPLNPAAASASGENQAAEGGGRGAAAPVYHIQTFITSGGWRPVTVQQEAFRYVALMQILSGCSRFTSI